MSWLEPSASKLVAYLDHLKKVDPPLYQLALVLAPALRVEPRLLRNARLRFLPGTEASLEARFWFSPLVANRSARSVAMRTGLARVLTDRLEQPHFDEVWGFIQQHTAHWPLLDRLEQNLRQAARAQDQARIQEDLREVLRQVHRQSGDSERRELARWVKGALPGIGAADSGNAPAELGLLAQFAAASLGDQGGGLSRRALEPGLPSWLAKQVPSGKGYALGLRLRPGVLECLAADAGGHRLDLDLPPPVPVHIRRDDGVPDPGCWEPLYVGRTVPLFRGCGRFVLTTPTGARYLLTATPTKQRGSGSQETRRVVIAHLPEDREAAERVAKLLAKANIQAKLVPESATHNLAEVDEIPILRLWTQAAARQMVVPAPEEPPGSKTLVLRMDDTPLAEGSGDMRLFDFSQWRDDPLAKSAEQLVETLRELLTPHIHGWPAAKVQALQQDTAQALGCPVVFCDRLKSGGEGPDMVVIPAGRFLMGSPEGKGSDDECPQHQVSIKQPFAIGCYPITLGEFTRFVEKTKYNAKSFNESYIQYGKAGRRKIPPTWLYPGFRQGDRHPVVGVSWDDARAYCDWLSKQTGTEYRLPTEAEWEYACRAGTVTSWYWGEGVTDADIHAWYETNSEGGTHPVGEKKANAWSLHDMAGIVWEWCEDCYHKNYQDAPDDGVPWLDAAGCDTRILRGGSWNDNLDALCSANRLRSYPSDRDREVGFRVVCNPNL